MKQVLLFFFWLTSLSAMAGNITVQNGNDAGPGSLRQAIADAKNGDVIVFNKPIIVLLTSGQLVIDKNITVAGKGSTIKGSFTPLIKAEAGKIILLKNFIFWEDSPKPAGAILNLTRNLKLESCSLITNKEVPGGHKLVAIKIANPKISGLLPHQIGGGEVPVFHGGEDPTNDGGLSPSSFNGDDGSGGGNCTGPNAPDISVTQPVCGSNTGSVTINSPVGTDIQYSIAIVGQTSFTLTTSPTFTLDAGNSYTIYSLFISTSCRSAEAAVVTIASSTPIINVVPPPCDGSTGTVAVTSPAGADYEYSNDGGASYQANPTFTVTAGTPYSITVHQISTGCVSTATTGTMATSNSIVYVNANATGLNNGTNWTNAYNNLQDALANTGGCVTQIWVAKGTYYPDQGQNQTAGDRASSFVLQNNLAIYGSFDGTETDLSQRGSNFNLSILNGDITHTSAITDNAYHVVTANGVNNTAILDGFRVSNGNGNGGGNNGGGMLNSNGASPMVSNCNFLNNTAISGGGMSNISGASPTISNCTFSNNIGVEAGGGMENLGASPSLRNCSFSGNKAQFGGAMSVLSGSSPSIVNCLFSGNNVSASSQDQPVMGGGIYIIGSSPTFINCSFYENTATGNGLHSIVQGGALRNYSNSSTVLTNCSFSGNSVTTTGGGSTAGGAIYNLSAICNLTNCIVWNNSTQIEGDAATVASSIVKGGYTGAVDIDPMFVDPDNGDLHLQLTSPAIDAGSDAANNQTTDLDGNNRKYDAIPGGALIDMGAFENQQLVPQHTTTTVSTGNPACPGADISILFSVFDLAGDITTGNVIIKDNGIPIFEVGAYKGYAYPVHLNTPGDHLIEADYEGAPGYAPSNSTTSIQKIFDLPTVDFSGLPQSICSNAAAVVLTGSPAGGTFSGPGISGTSFNPSVAGSGNQSIYYNYTDANGCSNSKSYSVIVNPANMATITGNAIVCLGSSPNPTVTFATSGGIAPYAFSYTVNDDPTMLTALSLSGTATVEVPTNVAGSSTYKLVGVVDNSIGTCFQIAANPSVTVTVNPLPLADISGSASVCQNGSAAITFSGSGGTAPYTFTYTSYDGSTQTTTSALPPITVPTVVPGSWTYTLISVADAGCSQLIPGKSAVVTINPLPVPAIITAGTVTAASSGNVASVTDAGTGATYVWTITGGTISAGDGTRAITYTAGNSGSVFLSVVVKSGFGCGPVMSATVQVAITAQPCPNPAISVPSSVCSATTGNKASVANAGTGAKYVWSITNGTITGGAGTNQITFTAATNKYADYDADDYVNLSVKVTNASGTCTEASGTYKVFISPIPSATISTASTVCSLSGNNFASVPFGGIGAKYTWSITNGSITWGAGTRSIAYTANASGSVVLAVTVTNSNGCSASSGNKTITIVAVPVANITAAASVCGGSGSNTASVTNGGTGAKYCWGISNGCINSGSSTNSISYTAGSSGSVTLSVTVTNSSGCKTTSANKLVTIIALPNAVITAASSTCANSTGNVASVGSAASYSWSISGGTITSGGGTNSIKYTAGATGYVTLGVSITNSNGCKAAYSKKISIVGLPAGTITTSSSVCTGSSGNIASVGSAGTGATYAWSISNGTITSGGTTSGIKYTAGLSGTVTLNITVTNSTGCKATGSKNVTIIAATVPTFAQVGPLCQKSTAPSLPTKSLNGITGTWSPSKVTTSTVGTTTYTFTPAAGQCASATTMKITVKNCSALSGTNIVSNLPTISKAVLAMDAVIFPNPSENFFTLVIKGNRKEVAEIRVMDVQGRGLDHFRVAAGGSVQFGGNYAHGTYIVQVMQGSGQKQLKVIKL